MMAPPPSTQTAPRAISIWWFAFGYFAAYAPYSALTKALSKGQMPGMTHGFDGFTLLPSTVLASAVGMVVFLWATGWWRHATRHSIAGFSVPGPTRATFVSGLCTSAILVTTTLAYTFGGISIVFAMLLMRGGVLVLAPVIDLISRRHVRWFSWTALGLSLLALVVANADGGGFAITAPAALDIGVYLAAYFVRLRLMSHGAKAEDPRANVRYFVEEQLVCTPAILLVLALWAASGVGDTAEALAHGFIDVWREPTLPWILAVGVLSQGTGIFGGLILLDKRENTFCVPVNRASSVVAGLVASVLLWWFFETPLPPPTEAVGAALLIVAVVVLSVPTLTQALRGKRGTP